MRYDVFISHASEDKARVAIPLAHQLKKLGLRVWFDEFELTLGDSLRRSIDHGLSESKFGIVILSPNFFRKEWSKRELDGLVARDDGREKVILPIWHNITKDEIAKLSPLLADKLAVPTSHGIKRIAEQVFQVVRSSSKATTSKQITRRAPKSHTYDVYISSPIGGFQSGRKYSASRRSILRLIDVLRERCKFKNIFYYGAQIESYKDIDVTGVWNIRNAFEAIKDSKYYILVFPERIMSGALVEAGYALAVGVPSAYFVRDKNDLPYHLRIANQAFDHVKLYEYKDLKGLLQTIEKHGAKLFELDTTKGV